MDMLMFLHLFVYPMLTGASLLAALWAASIDRIMLFVFLGWLTCIAGFMAITSHMNYQGYFV